MDYINYFKSMQAPLLTDKVAIVTGSSKGIGAGVALKFAENGADVVVCYNTNADQAVKIAEQVESLGRKAHIFGGDLGDFSTAKRLAEETVAKFGRIDILVNNAGITKPGFFLTVNEQDFDRGVRGNLKNTYNCCYNVVPYMMEQRYGKIMNMSSICGKNACFNAGIFYAATKAAAIGVTKDLAVQLAEYNINVNCIAPCMIRSEMLNYRTPERWKRDLAYIPLHRVAEVHEASETITFLCSDYANYITGYTIDVNGGAYMD